MSKFPPEKRKIRKKYLAGIQFAQKTKTKIMKYREDNDSVLLFYEKKNIIQLSTENVTENNTENVTGNISAKWQSARTIIAQYRCAESIREETT